MVGEPSEKAAELRAHTLAALGTGARFVVHAPMAWTNEISTTCPDRAFRIDRGRFSFFAFSFWRRTLQHAEDWRPPRPCVAAQRRG